MKNRTITRLILCAVAFLMMTSMHAGALAYDALSAKDWLEQFSQALTSLVPVNDPFQTADPARAGQYLIEYEFGTVLSSVELDPFADEILEINVRTSQVTDCRGVRVGMDMSAALDQAAPEIGGTQLYVLNTHDFGWSWAYVGESGVYGVEYIAYSGDESGLQEYTLTYVIDNGVISAIRMQAAKATLAQAQDGLKTALEIADKQARALLITANAQPAYAHTDFQVMGHACLGQPVANLVAYMGEPAAVQTLPQGAGRVLTYDGAVVHLMLDEKTGEEVVRSISVSSSEIEGPRRLSVGMGAKEAGALARCDENLYSGGGMLYLAGEALGEAPYGEMKVLSGSESQLTYVCTDERGDELMLLIGIQDDNVAYWQLAYAADVEGGI